MKFTYEPGVVRFSSDRPGSYVCMFAFGQNLAPRSDLHSFDDGARNYTWAFACPVPIAHGMKFTFATVEYDATGVVNGNEIELTEPLKVYRDQSGHPCRLWPELTASFLVIAGTGRPYLRAALESLQRQSLPNWEAIVIEACEAANDTTEAMRQVQEVNDSRVHVVFYTGERGYPPYASRKWNQALTFAKGELIAFLDDDDMKEDNWLEAMASPLIDNENIATTLCNGINIDKDAVHHGQLFGSVSLDYQTLILGNFVTTGQLLVRRRAIEAIGGFDGELSCAEDYDFCLRLATFPACLVESTRCLKRDSGDNACYNAGGFTQIALKRIIAKQGVSSSCYGCGKEGADFVWCVPNVGFRNWHHACYIDRGRLQGL